MEFTDSTGRKVELSWKQTKLVISAGQTIEILESKEILNTQVEDIRNTDNSTLHVLYSEAKEKNLVVVEKKFTGSKSDARSLFHLIDDHIKGLGRPKKLLVLINPRSGKRKAWTKYNDRVAPLLRRCDIDTEVRETRKSNDVLNILEDYNDLFNFSGVIAVGGDGFYCECVTALLRLYQKKENIDVNDPDAKLYVCKLPVGIIPAGSGDYVAKYLHGTRDVVTATIKIILGNTVQTNVASLHEGGKLVSYSGLLLGFNLFGEMMHDCEKFRNLGPIRYHVVPFTTMLTRQAVDVKIEYLSLDKKSQKSKNNQLFKRQISCPVIITHKTNKYKRVLSIPGVLDDNDPEWNRTSGTIYGIDTYPLSFEEKSKKLHPKFGNDTMTTILTDKCKLMQHVKQLTKVKNLESDCYDFDFIRKLEVLGFRVTLPSWFRICGENEKGKKKYYINCDGEVIQLTEPQFEVRLHSKVINIYGECH